jgi:hypothetical protein
VRSTCLWSTGAAPSTVDRRAMFVVFKVGGGEDLGMLCDHDVQNMWLDEAGVLVARGYEATSLM